ncbi:MAG: hypothetical protein CVT60_01490 [Actinobacteria bacterium HGW-Actinobacteria-10]|jgi:hypothetical protein|nr:MAG: hypothetical protein CVT60_01490 [Actinobacteria bacterium HGW-Actinobacteria-10]
MSVRTDKSCRFGIPQLEWDSMVLCARDLLQAAAQDRRTITYGELSAVATELRLSARSAGLMALLDEAARPLDECTGTIMATLVVRKDTGRPGEGYFAWMSGQGKDLIDHEALWRTEAERVWAAFAAD